MKTQVPTHAPPALTWTTLFKVMGGTITERRISEGVTKYVFQIGGLVCVHDHDIYAPFPEAPGRIVERYAHHLLTGHGELVTEFCRKNQECRDVRDELLKNAS